MPTEDPYASYIGLLLGVDKIFEYQLEKETDFLPADGDGLQDELSEHLKKANDELLDTAKYYKGKCNKYKKKMDSINTERKREINSVKNFYQTLLFAHSRSAIIFREAVSKINK